MAGLNISTGRKRRPYKLVVSGVEGVGKSTFAANAPAPLFADIENGTSSLDVARVEDLNSFDDVMNLIGHLYDGEHEYKSFVVDSASVIERWINEKVAKQENVKSVDEIPYGKGFGIAAEYFAQFLRGLDALVDRGIHVIVICHTIIRRFDDPAGDSFDQYDVALGKRLAPQIKQWSDTLLFADHDRTTVQKGEGFNKRTVAKSAGERVMWTQHRASHGAKNRYNLPERMPLDWQTFDKAVADFFKQQKGKAA